MGKIIVLTNIDILIAACLMIITVLISSRMRLKLEKTLLIASVRTIVQLSLIGLVLAWVFAQNDLYFVLLILSFITLAAAWAARNRIKRPYVGVTRDVTIAIAISGWSIALIRLLFIFKTDPWYTPQYAIPILGLILGNTLTGISISSDHFINALHKQQQEVQLYLSMSATPWEAVRPMAQDALRVGMMPTINSMMVVGLVSLPGMMTGQILAGADPINAVKYQIVTMFLICAASSLGSIVALTLVFRRFFNQSAQLVFPTAKAS